jgi:hypothetical protein
MAFLIRRAGCIHCSRTRAKDPPCPDAFWLTASEHRSLYVTNGCRPPVKAVVLLAHGMAEHAGRYRAWGMP